MSILGVCRKMLAHFIANYHLKYDKLFLALSEHKRVCYFFIFYRLLLIVAALVGCLTFRAQFGLEFTLSKSLAFSDLTA